MRPAFRERGGDVKLVRVTGGKVIVRFQGVCSGCPAAPEAHRQEIQRFLRSEVPGVESVIVQTANRRSG